MTSGLAEDSPARRSSTPRRRRRLARGDRRDGRQARLRGRGRFVASPARRAIKIDSRLLADIAYLKAKYKIAITAGYALQGHAHNGEHPVGLGARHRPRRRRLVARHRPPRASGPSRARTARARRSAGSATTATPATAAATTCTCPGATRPTERGSPAPWVRVLAFKGGPPTRSPGASLRPLASARTRRAATEGPHRAARAAALPRAPPSSRPTWKAAGKAFGIRWSILAAITQIESGFGCNMGPSSARRPRLDPVHARHVEHVGDGRRRRRQGPPYNSVDAIFSSRPLPAGLGRAAQLPQRALRLQPRTWYVNKVLARVEEVPLNQLAIGPGGTAGGGSLKNRRTSASCCRSSLRRMFSACVTGSRCAGFTHDVAPQR